MAVVTVYDKKMNKRILEAALGENLMQLLGRYHIFFQGNCGGVSGSAGCGACEVLVDGLKKKACKYKIQGNCNVLLNFVLEEQINTVLSGSIDFTDEHMDDAWLQGLDQEPFIAVDLGTTTIGFLYVDVKNKIQKELGIQNPQCAYGADVATRIQMASDEKGLQELQQIVLDAIYDGCCELLQMMDQSSIIEIPIYVTGNTTMLHILCGHSPASIGAYPFIPIHPEAQVVTLLNMNIHTLPCVSGYIGADVLVGAFVYQLHRQSELNLFIDLGTNGEMILGNKDRLLATSVAAGPAFERVLKGADGLKMLHQLYQTGQMDETGLLQLNGKANDGMEDIIGDITSEITIGDTTITQTMVRELQLAKGAVRAGIELLCETYACQLSDINKVYVAGGFGFYLDVKDAIALGMFPKQFHSNIEVVGNSSLVGCALSHNRLEELSVLASKIETMDLAMNEKFNERYIQYMNFNE